MLPRLLRAANSRPRYMQHDQNEAGQCERPPWSPSWTSSPKRRCLGMHDGHCRRRPTVQGEQAEPTQHALQFHYARPCRSLQPGEGWKASTSCARSDTNAEQSMNWQRGVTRARQNPHVSTPSQPQRSEGTTPHRSDFSAPAREWHWLTTARLMAPCGTGLQSKGQCRRWHGPVWHLSILKKR